MADVVLWRQRVANALYRHLPESFHRILTFLDIACTKSHRTQVAARALEVALGLYRTCGVELGDDPTEL